MYPSTSKFLIQMRYNKNVMALNFFVLSLVSMCFISFLPDSCKTRVKPPFFLYIRIQKNHIYG